MRTPRPLVAILILLSGCSQGPGSLRVELADSVAGVVLVHGRQSPEGITVRTAEGMPALAGEFDLAGGALRFTPRFPLEGVPALIVAIDTQRWTLPLTARVPKAPSTRVVAIHPSSPVLPANQLRWYVEFSAPMREGSALGHVRVRDQRGREVEKAFLELDQELWDPTRTRLTLMFDMGRVKQGIQSRADLGPILLPGRHYRLEIDREWLDARGVALVADTVHPFRTKADRRDPIDPTRWRIGSITRGTRSPLLIEFGAPLDHALGERMIVVTSADGEAVGGTATLVKHDTGLEFVPSAPWAEADYQVRVHPELEDVAGNRVWRAFDAPVTAGVGSASASREVVLAVRAR